MKRPKITPAAAVRPPHCSQVRHRAHSRLRARSRACSIHGVTRVSRPDQRADMVLHEMTLAEKIQMVHGIGWGPLRNDAPVPPGNNGGAGEVVGILRLGITDLNQADSAVGIRMAARDGRYAAELRCWARRRPGTQRAHTFTVTSSAANSARRATTSPSASCRCTYSFRLLQANTSAVSQDFSE